MVCRVSRGASRTSGPASAWKSSTVPLVAMLSSLTLGALNTGEHRKCVIKMVQFALREVRRVNNGESGQSAAEWRKLPFTSDSHTFPSEQFQVRSSPEICIALVSQVTLHLGLGLHLETSTWLSSPVFMEKSGGGGAASLRVEARGWSLQPAPGKHDGSTV